MCNCFHQDEMKPMPERGIGYKIVKQYKDEWCTFIHSAPYKLSLQSWIVWDPTLDPYRADRFTFTGFCFFLDKRTAERALKAWNNESQYEIRGQGKVVKIRYEEGCPFSFTEKNFIERKVRIGLCHSFKIL